MDKIINKRVVSAVQKMILEDKSFYQIDGFNIFIKDGIVSVYQWADDVANIIPPLVFSVGNFKAMYM